MKLSLAAALFVGLSLAGSAHGATIGELGILQGSANGGINPATGNPWQTGDQYRLAFVTSGTRDAASPDIADYDAFVQSAAAAVGWGGATWRCVGQSWNDQSAPTNTGTGGGGGVAIFLADGITKIADNYSDLWDGSIDNHWDLTETGAVYAGAVASGSNRRFGDPNQAKIEHGRQPETGGAWWQVYNGNQTSQWHFYALSEPLTVVAGGPDTAPPVLVSTVPADDSAGFPINDKLVATFDETIIPGSGYITIRNLSESNEMTIAIDDATQVSVAGKVLTIAPAAHLLPSTDYAVRIDQGAVLDYFTNAFPGISDNTTWSFTSGGDSLLIALEELTDYIAGAIPLTGPQIAAHKAVLDAEKGRLDESVTTIAAALDLVSTYDSVVGPLWVPGSPVQSFTRSSASDEDINWVVYNVMQYIMDEVYNAGVLADPAKRALLDGFPFGSSASFPGACDPPADPNNTHTAVISASYPDTRGRYTQGDGPGTFARKPTGCYLAPGTIATVTVPPALVSQGYQVRVGCHSWDFSNKPSVKRLDRCTRVYEITALQTRVANPLGGGIYIEAPFLASNGVVNVDITGAVRAPYFSAKSFHRTTPTEWLTERTHPAPWADFQSDKFMMQVPTSWIYAMPDPTPLMADWDAAMDAINDLMGFPRIRGKETMYPQVDLLMRASVYAPGYPSVNATYSPTGNYGGYANSHLVRGPQYAPDYEFHEQGHAYFFPKFGGETESNVNLLHVAVWHQKFGYSLDEAFRKSRGYNRTYMTLDTTAMAWMCVFNFSPREVPMAAAEKAYQLKGHAKFVDIARLYGWEALNDFWASFVDDEENGVAYSTDTDSMLLRLCRCVGKDIRPLFHFWGIYPVDAAALAAAVAAEGIPPDPAIRDRLLHYKTLVPPDNAAFRAFALGWWGKQPSIDGYWEEREHARQWDETPLYGEGDQQRSELTNPGEIYNEHSAADITARVQELVDLYFPRTITPDPMHFALPPSAVDANTIGMVAAVASADTGPIEYRFENTTAGHVRDWSTDPTWNDTGLAAGVTYSFRVKARAGAGNETAWSAEWEAVPGNDVTPPSPDPMSFSALPTALDEASITMTAAAALDVNGVQYSFECTSPGGHDSGWQDSPVYTDTGLLPAVVYTYRVRARDKSSGGNATAPSSAAAAMTGARISDHAAADVAVSGTVSGSFADTAASDNGYLAITEIESGGRASRRYSYLEHKWPFTVTGGATVTFHVEAYHSANSEGDDFVFAYSTNGMDGAYQDMVTVTKTSDDNAAQTFALPPGTRGTVYVRVVDTDRSRGNRSLDTLWIDEMYFASEISPAESDLAIWKASYGAVDLNDLAADLDGDGLSNGEERIWGLDPTSAASCDPFAGPFDPAAGMFCYTRRDPARTGWSYEIWTSGDLRQWALDAGAVQTPGSPDTNGVERVVVTLSPALLDTPSRFVRVRARE